MLEKALASANQITDSNSKAEALTAIAESISKLNQPEKQGNRTRFLTFRQ